MAFTLCTSGSATIKAGTSVSTTILGDQVALNRLSDDAEGRIEAETRRSWVANFETLTSGSQNLLADICSSLVAMNMISYDTTGYLSREADTLLNVLDDRASDGLRILKDFKSDTIKSP